MTKLVLRGVERRFGSTLAVAGLDLDIRPGEFVSLLGPSGCGKTTTLRMIAGFIDPTAGTIEMDGKVLSSPAGSLPPERRDMSMIFQSYAIWPNMTVEQNVAFGLELRRISADEVRRRVREMLEVVHMGHLAGRYPAELSGGQQQRVALARAIVIKPSVLLLDEPLSNLDANLREEMRFEVRRLHDAYRYTTVYVTHDQSEAMTTADLIAVMNAGRIEQAGPPEEIYARPRSEFVARFIGSSNIVKGKNLDAHHISVAGKAVRCSGASLARGGETAVSIRQHDIRLSATPPPETENVLSGLIVRQVFLGGARDYMVELGDGTQLRVVRPAGESIAQGANVWVYLPPEHCRALTG